MRFDMDLCRKIMMVIEGSAEMRVYDIRVEGYSAPEIAHGCNMLKEMGVIDEVEVCEVLSKEGVIVNTGQLTWAGCELMEWIRRDESWETTKKEAQREGILVSPANVEWIRRNAGERKAEKDLARKAVEKMEKQRVKMVIDGIPREMVSLHVAAACVREAFGLDW